MAFVWDRGDLKGRYFINGVLTNVESPSADGGYGYDLVSSNHAVYDIGLKRDSKFVFHGYLRDLMVYKRALDTQEIESIFNGKSCN